MINRSSFFVALVVMSIALAVAWADEVDRAEQRNAPEPAIAEILEQDMSYLLEFLPVVENGIVYDSIPLCLDAQFAMDFDELNRALATKKLQAHSIEDCEVKRVQGEHSVSETYLNPNGDAAEHLMISSIYRSPREYAVDIERWFRIDRYVVKRAKGSWTVASRENLILRD